MPEPKVDQGNGIIVKGNEPEPVVEPKEDVKAPEVPFLEIDGEKLTKEQAVAGYMKNKDYTTKTQELSKQKVDLETKGKSLDELQTMADWFDNEDNQEGAEMIRKIIRGEKVNSSVDPSDPDIDPDDPTYKLAQENKRALAEINKNFNKLQTSSKNDAVSRAQKDIASEKKQAMAKYDFLDEEDIQEIVDLAYARDGANIVEIADKYVARLKKYGDSNAEAIYKEKEKNQKIPIDSGGGGGSPAVKTKLEDGSAKRSFSETLKKAFEADK